MKTIKLQMWRQCNDWIFLQRVPVYCWTVRPTTSEKLPSLYLFSEIMLSRKEKTPHAQSYVRCGVQGTRVIRMTTFSPMLEVWTESPNNTPLWTQWPPANASSPPPCVWTNMTFVRYVNFGSPPFPLVSRMLARPLVDVASGRAQRNEPTWLHSKDNVNAFIQILYANIRPWLVVR